MSLIAGLFCRYICLFWHIQSLLQVSFARYVADCRSVLQIHMSLLTYSISFTGLFCTLCRWLQHTAPPQHSNVGHASFPRVTPLLHTCDRTYTHCNILQHTATHCNALQPTTPHCNTLQHTPLLHTCDRTYSQAWRNTWLRIVCDMTHIHVTWLTENGNERMKKEKTKKRKKAELHHV